MHKIFWNTVRNLPFFSVCKSNIWQEFHEVHLDNIRRPESRHAKLSDIAFQYNDFSKNKCVEREEMHLFFIIVIKAQWRT